MKLELENGELFSNPDAQTIAQALRHLSQHNSFAILSTSDMAYVQTAINPDGTFVLEYQAGSLETHYQATTDLSRQQVIEVFQGYAQNDLRWQTVCDWEKLTL